MPRYLNVSEASKILSEGAKGAVDIMYVDGNAEAFQLAITISGLLSGNGWQVPMPRPVIGQIPQVGVALEIGGEGLQYKDNTTPDLPEPGMTLFNALNASLKGIRALNLGTNQRLPAGALVIIVGPKF
jgi:hypothetical protein